MIESHYSLNVAFNGEHYCRIHLGTSEAVAKEKAAFIWTAFKEQHEGFTCDLAYVECIGHSKSF